MHVYPLTRDLARARRLARGRTARRGALHLRRLALPQQAQIVKADLVAIGIGVEIKAFPAGTLFAKYGTPGEPFDIGYVAFSADYPDPDNFLNLLLESGTVIPTLQDPVVRRKLAAAARLSGPQRYLTYGQLDLDIARDAAPWIAYATPRLHEFFAAQVAAARPTASTDSTSPLSASETRPDNHRPPHSLGAESITSLTRRRNRAAEASRRHSAGGAQTLSRRQSPRSRGAGRRPPLRDALPKRGATEIPVPDRQPGKR